MYFFKELQTKMQQKFEGRFMCIREGFVKIVLEGQIEHFRQWEQHKQKGNKNICSILLGIRHCTKTLNTFAHLSCTINL